MSKPFAAFNVKICKEKLLDQLPRVDLAEGPHGPQELRPVRGHELAQTPPAIRARVQANAYC